MKLIVTGATGFVGSEVVRQALRNPAVTSVIAIARRAVVIPPNQDASKLQSFILDDWTSTYPESLKELIKAVTPSQSRTMDFSEVTAICHDYTINGIRNMIEVANKPFRFVYVSGVSAERDQNKDLPQMEEHLRLRGRTENCLLEIAKENSPNMEVTVAKPGAIEAPNIAPLSEALQKLLIDMYGHIPRVNVSELAAAMIDQCQNGITKDPLWSNELAGIGKRLLKREDYL